MRADFLLRLEVCLGQRVAFAVSVTSPMLHSPAERNVA